MKRRLGDRRGRPRFEIVGDLWGTLDTIVGLPLVNIGRGGALVQSSVPLPADSIHQVMVSCDGQQTPTSVQVRHVRPITGLEGPPQFLIGLAFLSVPAALQAQIDTWMDDDAHVLSNGV